MSEPWLVGRYKLFSDAHKSVKLTAKIILSKGRALYFTFHGPSYLGLFELVTQHKWLNLELTVLPNANEYAATREMPKINSFRIVGPLHSEDDILIQYNVLHTQLDNSNIYRIFRDGSLQTLKLRNTEKEKHYG